MTSPVMPMVTGRRSGVAVAAGRAVVGEGDGRGTAESADCWAQPASQPANGTPAAMPRPVRPMRRSSTRRLARHCAAAVTRSSRMPCPLPPPLPLPHAFEKISRFVPLSGRASGPTRNSRMRASSSGVMPARRCGAASRSISVSTAPGLTATTRMPCGRPSTARISLSPATPNFDVSYALRRG